MLLASAMRFRDDADGVLKSWRRRGGRLTSRPEKASPDAKSSAEWERELRLVTDEKENPRESGGSVRRWSGKRDLNPTEAS